MGNPAAARTGYQTSELQLLIASMAFLWTVDGVSHEVAAYITGGVVAVYVVSRTWLKARGIGGDIGLVWAEDAPVSQAGAETLGALRSPVDTPKSVSVIGGLAPIPDRSSAGAGSVVAMLAALALSLGLVGCSALGSWLVTPIGEGEGQAAPGEPVAVELPEGAGSVELQLPEAPAGAGEPVTVALGAGASATWTPPATQPPANPAPIDVIGQVGGAIAANATGLPWLALLIPSLAGAFRRRKEGAR